MKTAVAIFKCCYVTVSPKCDFSKIVCDTVQSVVCCSDELVFQLLFALLSDRGAFLVLQTIA